MNTNKIKVIIIVLTAVVMVTGAVCFSQKCRYRRYGAEKIERIFKKLNLTQKQQKILQENRDAQRRQMIQIGSAMKEKQARLQEALRESNATRVSVEPLVNEIKSLQSRSLELRVDAIFAVKQVLTPEQFVKFQQIMDKHKEARKNRFQSWHTRGKKKEY